MKDHPLVALGLLLTALAAPAASAQPAAPPHPGPAKADKPGPGAGAKPDKMEAKAAKAEERAVRGEARAERGPDSAGPDGKGAPGLRGGPMQGRFRSGLQALHQELKEGKIKKEELKDRVAKLRETAAERRKEHREALKSRWGAALAQAPAREELRHHARRMAFLNRALLVAQTEVKKDKDKLIERIEKLIEKETARHEKAMARFSSASPSAPAAAAAAPATVPAAAPAEVDAKEGAK
jgi:hypothetical protein